MEKVRIPKGDVIIGGKYRVIRKIGKFSKIYKKKKMYFPLQNVCYQKKTVTIIIHFHFVLHRLNFYLFYLYVHFKVVQIRNI